MHIIRLRCVKRLRKFHINIEYTTQVELTPRTLATAEAFGLGVDEEKRFVVCNCDIDVNAGEIVYITGDSGSGKSSILREFQKQFTEEFQKTFADECVNINDLTIDTEKPLVDTVGASVEEALKLLSFVGLNDAFLFLRKFGELSDGQKYRYKIAKLLESKKRVWILDEFTSTLDRDTAKIVAWNLQKFARLSGVTVLCATCMTDLGDDLAPNVRVDKRYNSEIKVTYNADAKARQCSLVAEMVVEQGTKDDWKALAEFHYRSHNVMIPLKIMRLVRWTPEMHERCKTEKQCPNNTQCSACGLRRLYHELVGVLVFSVPPISIYGRKQYFGKCFNRSREEMQELNANFTLISRVVIHPKYRSMNLGVTLVRESLKQAPKRYVETIAVMAKYNPFFERAGMLKVCDRKIDKYTQDTLTALNAFGFEATFMTSHSYNLNKLNNLSAEQQLNVKRALVRTCRGPTFNDYMKQRNLDRSAPDFSERLCAQDNEFIAHLIYRVALMATPKVYLVWDKAWLEHPELCRLPSDFQTTAPSTGLHKNVKNYGAS